MVVAGSSGMGAVGRLLMGSVSTGLVHHAHCPVAVIRPEEASAANQNAPVLLGIDGSPASEAATAWAFDEASRHGVPLVALHVWSDVGVFPILGTDWQKYESQGEDVLAERLAGWQEQIPTCTCGDGSNVTSPPAGSVRNPIMLSWWWSAVTVAADSLA